MKDLGKALTEDMQRQHLNQNFAALRTQSLSDPVVQAFLNEHQNELLPDAAERSIAKIYEFVQQKNKLENGEITFAPGYEPRLVVNNHLVDVSYQLSPQKAQQENYEKIQKRITVINLPKDLREASFEKFDLDSRQNTIEAAVNFVENYQQKGKKFVPGLFLTGRFGVGKTYLLGAIANQLASTGTRTTLLHFPTFVVEMKNAIKNQKVWPTIERIKKAPVLMLDDIGADNMSPWIRDDILGVILQYRMQEQLSTFFSSNFTMQELEKGYLSNDNQEPVKAKRIMERIQYLSREIVMEGPDRRQK